MTDNKTIVNSWNEWDPLKHAIVGRADGTCIPAPEPALDAKVPEDSDMRGQFGPRTKDTVDKANQLLDDFSNMLIKKGVKVDRPTPIDFNKKTSTPDWEAETMFGCMPPRDVLLTVGNEILEATMSYRCRWFEYLCYRPLLQEYYNQDPNMRHESAPKPRLTDKDYRKDYLSDKIGIQKRLEWTEDKFFVTTEEEPLFDAVDTIAQTLQIFADMVPQISVNQEIMLSAAEEGFATATDLADYLVKKGMPFRDAHESVAHAVKLCVKKNCALSDLSLADLIKACGLNPKLNSIDKDVFTLLSPKGSVHSRNHIGGTAPKQVLAAIKRARTSLKK